MNWMNKLERKFGRYAIPNISRYFVLANVIGFLGAILFPSLMGYLQFSPYAILHGQVWRLVSWVFIPAGGGFLGLLFLFFALMWGASLEYTMGTFRMNVFFFQAMLLCDVGGMVIYAILRSLTGIVNIPVSMSTYYILMSMLLALAMCMPEAEVRIYFVLPIRMKWMLIFELLFLAYDVYSMFSYALSILEGAVALAWGFALSAQILLPIGSMFLFFWFSKTRIGWRQKKRQREFRAQFSKPRPGSGIVGHKCAICGRTDQDAPNMVFRYCSKCKGNLEYCEEHLFMHRHVE
ncbi:MAG: hypothetical protein J1D89_02340 [Agathobacter sp.]|nr:hypothetical protein [Agathobacter sp.]